MMTERRTVPGKKIVFITLLILISILFIISSSRNAAVNDAVSAFTNNVKVFHAKLTGFGKVRQSEPAHFMSGFESTSTAEHLAYSSKMKTSLKSTTVSRNVKKIQKPKTKVKIKVKKQKTNVKISFTTPARRKIPVLPPKYLFQTTNRTVPPIRLILMSTWRETEEKKLVHGNVLRTWKLWKPTITPLLFTNDSALASEALKNEWRVLPLTSVTCGEMPIMRDMYLQAMARFDSVFYGFSNSDILLSEGLKETVKMISDLELAHTRPVMLLVSRTNVNFSEGPRLDDVTNMEEMKSKGWPLTDGSSDVFITNRLFPWKYVPDAVIGRLGIGMWIVAYARALNVTVIDITKTTIAIHMTTSSGNYESHWKPNSRCNHIIYNKLGIKPPSWRCGFIHCAAMETSYSRKNNTIRLTGRNWFRYDSRCLQCPMNLTSILN